MLRTAKQTGKELFLVFPALVAVRLHIIETRGRIEHTPRRRAVKAQRSATLAKEKPEEASCEPGPGSSPPAIAHSETFPTWGSEKETAERCPVIIRHHHMLFAPPSSDWNLNRPHITSGLNQVHPLPFFGLQGYY
jgi:hypothetical protein